jgi:hypothetical protein
MDSIPILQETVRIFKETETIESSEVLGTVNKLEHEGEMQGGLKTKNKTAAPSAGGAASI